MSPTKQADILAKIGVFWAYKAKIMGRAVSLSDGCEAVSGRVDSDENHAQVWEEENHFAWLFSELEGREYFDLSRGRVLYQKSTQQPLVYCDPSLKAASIRKKIAEFFNFRAHHAIWVADLHYTTNPEDLSRLFDD